MSYGREIAQEMAIDDWIYRDKIREEAKTRIWRCRDGRTISVWKMETQHIKNVLAILKDDKTDIMHPWIVVFEKELKRRERMPKRRHRVMR